MDLQDTLLFHFSPFLSYYNAIKMAMLMMMMIMISFANLTKLNSIQTHCWFKARHVRVLIAVT